MNKRYRICSVILHRYPEFTAINQHKVCAKLEIKVKIENLMLDLYQSIPDEIALLISKRKIDETFYGKTYLYKRQKVKVRKRKK